MLDVLEKGNKEELIDLVKEMSPNDLQSLAKFVPTIRSSLNSGAVKRRIPSRYLRGAYKARVQRHSPGIVLSAYHSQDEIDDNEHKEINEKYAKRAQTPLTDFIKYESPEQLYELIMKDKKEKGWKFKDED